MLKESRQPLETQYFDLYHLMAPLPRSDTRAVSPHTLTFGLHSGGLCPPQPVSLYSETPHRRHLPSDWLRLFSREDFSRINILKNSSILIFLRTTPMKMKRKVLRNVGIQTAGNQPEESTQHSEHDESLK